jgi:osmotically-inducible protein OsmY
MVLSDRLCVRPFVEMDDDEIRRTVCHELGADSALQGCAISSWLAGKAGLVSRPRGAATGNLCVKVRRNRVRLEGVVPGHLQRRVAEVMAWWSLGARSVDNMLSILPEQRDSDEQLEQAVWYVLHSEPLLCGSRIEVSMAQREATLSGTVPDAPAREIAAFDTWFVPGVEEVHNRLVLRPREE